MKQKFFFLCALFMACGADATDKHTPNSLEEDAGSDTSSSESIASTELEEGWKEINKELNDLEEQNREKIKMAIDSITELILKEGDPSSKTARPAMEQHAFTTLLEELNVQELLKTIKAQSLKYPHSTSPTEQTHAKE